MRKFMILALAVLLVACSPTQQTETKDMNQLSFTTEQAAWMSAKNQNKYVKEHFARRRK